mmetsp:Transcript_77385/g.147207  ORF Transcript_77385/g.147207 Transcript_77385/m.147207 type:complete len:82 (+) Transcript_77385:423-668(+)
MDLMISVASSSLAALHLMVLAQLLWSEFDGIRLIKVSGMKNLNQKEVTRQQHDGEKNNSPYQHVLHSGDGSRHDVQMIQAL